MPLVPVRLVSWRHHGQALLDNWLISGHIIWASTTVLHTCLRPLGLLRRGHLLLAWHAFFLQPIPWPKPLGAAVYVHIFIADIQHLPKRMISDGLEWLYIEMGIGAAAHSSIEPVHLQAQFCIWSVRKLAVHKNGATE